MSEIILPSKWDIIPIHTSDRATFKSCRRKWNWSSPARNNLVRKVSVFGVYVPFWFGTGIHKAIEKYYDPDYSEDIVVAFETWFHQQTQGGWITEAELNEYADREPRFDSTTGQYWAQGLEDLILTYDHDEFAEYLDLGQGMLKYYEEYAQAHDNFTVIAVEQEFSVPLLDNDGNVFYAVDTREMPAELVGTATNLENLYGPLQIATTIDGTTVIKKQVHAKGRIDIIIQDNESGQYGIRDYKTASRVDDDYFRHLDLDEQVTTYSWAAEQMARLYDLPYKRIHFLDYQALLKAYPRPPTLTSRGLLSISRSTESTTAEMFAEAIDVLGQRAIFESDDRMQSYYAWLIETQDRRFINTERVRRNAAQKANCGRRLYYEAKDMLAPDIAIYPNPTKDYGCLNCHFRPPCVMVEDGGDYQILLTDGYVKNHDR